MELETIVESAETQEVAEPVETTEVTEGVEEQEAAEPVSEKTDADAAFAEMRRRNEELERELADSRRMAEESQKALGLFFEGDNKVAEAIAHYEQRPVEEVEAEMQAKTEIENLKAENERYKAEALRAQTERQMDEDLKALQSLDPNIKDLSEMSQAFLDMRLKAGLSVEQAYFASKALAEKTESKPAQSIGTLKTESAPKDFLSREEVKARENDEAWIRENYDLIKKSIPKW